MLGSLWNRNGSNWNKLKNISKNLVVNYFLAIFA